MCSKDGYLEAVERLKTLKHQYVAVIKFSRDSYSWPYGDLKGCMLHEWYHRVQFNTEDGKFYVIDPKIAPKGIEEEADLNALMTLKDCIDCAREFARCRPESSDCYLTRAQAEELVETFDHDKLCAYHKELRRLEAAEASCDVITAALQSLKIKIASGEIEP